MPLEVEVPKFIRDNAARGLRYHEEGKSGDGVVARTIREARDMAEEGRISEDKVRRMGPWFARHKVDMDAPANDPDNDAFPGKGAVAWLLWGGSTSGDIMDAAKWAERTVERLDRNASRLTNGATVENHMDTIESQLAAALEAASAKDTEVTEARAAVEKVAAENIELAAKVAALESTLAALSSEKATLAAQVEAAAATAVSASEEAAEIAASVGVAPIESAPVVAPKADVLEQYLSLSGAERAAFFAANKAAIMLALRN